MSIRQRLCCRIERVRRFLHENYFDHVTRKRHEIEVDARRYGGSVTWGDRG
jgi:hypothetical protein